MSQIKTTGIVLRGVDFSETSRIITLMTPDRGQVTCMAKGVRRKGSSLGAALDTFNHIDMVYYHRDGREVQQLGEASLLHRFDGIKANLERSGYGAFPMELAWMVSGRDAPSEDLFAVLVQGLEGLDSWTDDVPTHVAWQVLHLLRVAGFAPVLDRCVVTHGPVGPTPGFCYESGVVATGQPADRKLSATGYAALRALEKEEDVCPALPRAAGAEALAVLYRFARHQLETEFKSMRVIADLFGPV